MNPLDKVTESEAYRRLTNYFPSLSFEEEVNSNPELSEYIRSACTANVNQVENPRQRADAPKLDEDFSKYFLINNLPKCDEAKSKKLTQLLLKLYQKKNFNIDESNISMPLNEEGLTDGVAFILASSEEQAKLGAAIMNGYQLDKNHLLSASQINDFEKIMTTSDSIEETTASYSLMDLRDPLLDTKREQFLFQIGKEVHLKWHDSAAMAGDQSVTSTAVNSDKTVNWSPKGTYLIVIKHDKVEFHGGKKMQPIITLPEGKVDLVHMSPCERYVLTYAPMSKTPYVIWNFQLVEQIRDFDQKEGEDGHSYQWSHDGNYLSKKFRTEKPIEDGSSDVKVKTGISVYTLPTMELIQISEGVKKSITVEGVEDVMWAPNRNVLVYSAFPGENQHPRIGFIEIPSRQTNIKTFNNALSLQMFFHPQGHYLGVVNEYKEKKTVKYSIELFDTKKQSFPHQQILINREVIKFLGLIWEPNHGKLAVHTLAKRSLDAGKKDYTLDAQRSGIDIYEMLEDPIKGFITRTIGFLPSEKVTGFQWSGSGDVFNLFENEGGKNSVSFYIVSVEQQLEATKVVQQSGPKAFKGSGDPLMKNKLAGSDEKYEFKKTARYDIYETKYDSCWDQTGRYISIYGIKRSPLDKQDKSIRFYNILGEPLAVYDKLQNLMQFKWRPRPLNIIGAKDLNKLKGEYKTKYSKLFKDEEKTEKKQMNSVIKESKKKVREEFLNTFFLPLRREFESQKDKYEALWPIKAKDMAEQMVEIEIIYSYETVVSETRIQ